MKVDRLTYALDQDAFIRLMGRCTDRVLRDGRAGGEVFMGGKWYRLWPSMAPTWPPQRAIVESQLMAILKAYLDKAQAGGIALDQAQGIPIELNSIIDKGDRHARNGEGVPRLLRSLNDGKGKLKRVDRCKAEGLLTFLKNFLNEPFLSLHDLGARESSRLEASHQIEKAIKAHRTNLPQAVMSGLIARSAETAAYVSVQEKHTTKYAGLRLREVKGHDPVISLIRTTTYRPLSIVPYERILRPGLTYELYEGKRFIAARLSVFRLDQQGRRVESMKFNVGRSIDREKNVIVYAIDESQRAMASHFLRMPSLNDKANGTLELEWSEDMEINVVDRDIIVSMLPVDQPEIHFDGDAHPDFVLTVGDSDAIKTISGGWKLHRTLMPREVIAVRIRVRDMDVATLV